MQIYLLDYNVEMIRAWKKYFSDVENVHIVHSDFKTFMDENFEKIDIIVSPANSFGIMDGGYDRAITEYFGDDLQKVVQNKILNVWYGEQPVGTSMWTVIPNQYPVKFLIHTPSMRTPEVIKDARIIYQCMRTTLIEASKLYTDDSEISMVIPAFGGLTGRVDCETVAYMMRQAYRQIVNQPKDIPFSKEIWTGDIQLI